MPIDYVTVTALTTVPRWTCDLPGCGAQIVGAEGVDKTGWLQLTLGALGAGGGGGVRFFDVMAHAQQWMQQQPVPVVGPPLVG